MVAAWRKVAGYKTLQVVGCDLGPLPPLNDLNEHGFAGAMKGHPTVDETEPVEVFPVDAWPPPVEREPIFGDGCWCQNCSKVRVPKAGMICNGCSEGFQLRAAMARRESGPGSSTGTDRACSTDNWTGI